MAGEPTSAAELVAFIMAHFPDEMSQIIGPGKRGKRQKYYESVGVDVPNDRALALCAMAGDQALGLTLNDVKSFADRAASDTTNVRLSTHLRATTEHVAGVLRGEQLATEDLVLNLSKGLRANKSQKDFIRLFNTGSPLTPITPAAVAQYYEKFKAAVAYISPLERSVAKSNLFTTFSGRLKKLLPSQYPKRFSLIDLASAMDISLVSDPGRISADSGLYGYVSRTFSETGKAFERFAPEPRIVLLGNPGGGKSTILAGYCAYIVETHAAPAVLIRIPNVGRAARYRKPNTTEEAAEFVVDQWIDSFNLNVSSALRTQVAEDLISSADFVIAFDGLDELTSVEDQTAFRRTLHLLRDVSAKILISSRITGYTPVFRDCHTYYVEPLPPEGPLHFARRWFGPDAAAEKALQRAMTVIEHPQMAFSCRTPVILGLVCTVAETQEVQTSISGLYRQYLNQHLRRAWNYNSTERINVSDLASASRDAQDIAWAMANASTPAGGLEWLDSVELSWLVDVAGLPGRVLDLYEIDGLMVGHGVAPAYDALGQTIRWLHRTMHEHLVGWRLAAEIKRNFADGYRLLQARLIDNQWTVPIQYMAEALRDERVVNAILDSLIDQFRRADVPSKSMLNGAALIASSALTTHRFADVFVPSASTEPAAVEAIIESGQVAIESYCDLLGERLPDLMRKHYRLVRLVATHYPEGPVKAGLLKPTVDDRLWYLHIDEWLTCMRVFDAANAYRIGLEVSLNSPGVASGNFWTGMPSGLSEPLLTSLLDTLRKGSRKAFNVLQAIAYTKNFEIIGRAHQILNESNFEFFGLVLENYINDNGDRGFIRNAGHEIVESIASTGWGPQIEHAIGVMIAAAGLPIPRHVTAWVRVGWICETLENQTGKHARPENLDVTGSFRRFCQRPLPSDPQACINLYFALDWVRTGDSDMDEVEAFLQFFTSEGLEALDSYDWDIPGLDSTYLHHVLAGVGQSRLVYLARKVFANDVDSSSRFSRADAVYMLSTAIDFMLYDPLGVVEKDPALTFADLFVELTSELRSCPACTHAPLDFRFEETVPDAVDLQSIEEIVAALPQISDPENRARVAGTLERLLIALGYGHRVLDLLLLPVDSAG